MPRSVRALYARGGRFAARRRLIMRTHEEKAAFFWALHKRPAIFVIPNAWDAGTARALAALGFEALATTSLGLANTLGRSLRDRLKTRPGIRGSRSTISTFP